MRSTQRFICSREKPRAEISGAVFNCSAPPHRAPTNVESRTDDWPFSSRFKTIPFDYVLASQLLTLSVGTLGLRAALRPGDLAFRAAGWAFCCSKRKASPTAALFGRDVAVRLIVVTGSCSCIAGQLVAAG